MALCLIYLQRSLERPAETTDRRLIQITTYISGAFDLAWAVRKNLGVEYDRVSDL